MKRLSFILLLLPVLLPAQSVRGVIIHADDSTPVNGVRIYVDNYKREMAWTASTGQFYIDSLGAGKHTLRFSYDRYRDTLITITLGSRDYSFDTIRFTPLCPFVHKDVKHNCPQCRTMGEVIPIVYGFPTKTGMEREQKGEIYLGGCEIGHCDPYWYCKRCKREF